MNIHWLCYGTVHVYVVIYMCDSMWSFRVEENQEGNVRIPLTNLTPIWPRNIVVPVPNQDMEFNITCQGLYCIQWVQLRSEVVVRFVHIGGIDDHHCLNCLFIIVFFLVIVLSVLLRFTDSDYSFGIFKLFFKIVSDDHIKSQHGYCIYHYITEKHVTSTNIIYLW
jgi:hypothetical protein